VERPPQCSLTAAQLVAVLGAAQGQAADSTAERQGYKQLRTCQVVASARHVGLLSSASRQQRWVGQCDHKSPADPNEKLNA
jgi:hypothetical protein